MIHLPVLNVNYIVTPVGGENERLFMCERLFESVKHRFIKTEYSTTKTFIFLKKKEKKSASNKVFILMFLLKLILSNTQTLLTVIIFN